MPALVIKVDSLTYYNNYSTKEKCPNLHCYIDLNNISSLLKLMLPYSKSIRAKTCKVNPLTIIIIFPLKQIFKLALYMKHMLPHSKSIRAKTFKSQSTYHYNNIST